MNRSAHVWFATLWPAPLAGVAAAVGGDLASGPRAATTAGFLALVVTAAVLLGRAGGQDRVLCEIDRHILDWREGRFDARIRWARQDLLGRMADHVNETARALEEDRRLRSETLQRLSTILTGLDDGVLYLDQGRRIWTMNRVAEELYGMKEADARGLLLLEVVKDPELDRRVEQSLGVGAGEMWERDPGSGPERVLRYRILPTRAGNGGVHGVVLVVSDRTHERRLERVRQDFIANVTHELQTPLTSIRGFAETLMGDAGEDPATRQRFLGIIESEGQRLSRMVEDLLELSRWEGQRPPLRESRFDLGDLVREVAEAAGPLLKQDGLELRLELPPGPLPIRADRDALVRVVRNLVDNAHKYTSEGHVALRLFRIGHVVRLEVEDTGIGIPASALPRVFERFYRVDKARDRRSGGTGLGLAIVRHLVEAHGGSVRVQSAGFGLGSRFVVELPQRVQGPVGSGSELRAEDEPGASEAEVGGELGAYTEGRIDATADAESDGSEGESEKPDQDEALRETKAEKGQAEPERKGAQTDGPARKDKAGR